MKPWFRRLLCLLGFHAWQRLPPFDTDTWQTYGYRICTHCHKSQRCEADELTASGEWFDC